MLLRRNAWAVVRDLEADRLTVGAGLDHHCLGRRRKFDRVRDQVLDRLTRQEQGPGEGLWGLWVDLEDEWDLFLLGERHHVLLELAEQLRDRDLDERFRERVGTESRVDREVLCDPFDA